MARRHETQERTEFLRKPSFEVDASLPVRSLTLALGHSYKGMKKEISP